MRSRKPSSRLKTAEFTPIASVSVRITAQVKPIDLRNWRTAYRRSWTRSSISFVPRASRHCCVTCSAPPSASFARRIARSRRSVGLAVFFRLAIQVILQLLFQFAVYRFAAEEGAEPIEQVAEHIRSPGSPKLYSYRSAVTGSTPVAFQAGIKAAGSRTSNSKAGTTMKVTESRALTS